MSRALAALAKAALLLVALGAILFGVAGRLDWPQAWLFIALYAVFLALVAAWTLRRDPDLLEERTRVAANVKGWDKVILAVYTVLLIALLVTAAADAGRLRASRVPLAAQGAGVGMTIFSAALIGWSVMRNPFLSRFARIQDDRGQRVIDDGPYHHVRHPMYAAIIVQMFATALVLGSWWALIPAALIAILYIVRTALEDRMLQRELPGYPDYAARVRYRLLPRVW